MDYSESGTLSHVRDPADREIVLAPTRPCLRHVPRHGRDVWTTTSAHTGRSNDRGHATQSCEGVVDAGQKQRDSTPQCMTITWASPGMAAPHINQERRRVVSRQ